MDDSYDESDEEEVRAHLRRVAEQPPLKLDDSTEVRATSPHSQASPDDGKQLFTRLPFPPPETGLPPSRRPDHREPARRAGAAEEEEEEADAQGAQPFAPCHPRQAQPSSAPAQHTLHPRGDGPGPRAGG